MVDSGKLKKANDRMKQAHYALKTGDFKWSKDWD